MMVLSKRDTPADALRSSIADHIQGRHSRSVHLYTDGSRSPEGTGCAVVVEDGATSGHRLPPEASVYTSELFAILSALTVFSSLPQQYCTIFSDSQSALYAMRNYHSLHPILLQIHSWLIKMSSRHKRVDFCWVPSHTNIRGNEAADAAARAAAISARPFSLLSLPHRDYYPLIRAASFGVWQEEWTAVTDNKLRTIKGVVHPWHSSLKSRRMEIILTRLRIGHTLLTHGHLMERRPPPFCDDCLVPLTVAHLLLECPSLAEERLAFLNVPSDGTFLLADILSPRGARFSVPNLLSYLQATDIYNKL